MRHRKAKLVPRGSSFLRDWTLSESNGDRIMCSTMYWNVWEVQLHHAEIVHGSVYNKISIILEKPITLTSSQSKPFVFSDSLWELGRKLSCMPFMSQSSLKRKSAKGKTQVSLSLGLGHPGKTLLPQCGVAAVPWSGLPHLWRPQILTRRTRHPVPVCHLRSLRERVLASKYSLGTPPFWELKEMAEIISTCKF